MAALPLFSSASLASPSAALQLARRRPDETGEARVQASGRDPELGVGEILERSAQSRAASRAVPRFLRVVAEMECVSVCGGGTKLAAAFTAFA